MGKPWFRYYTEALNDPKVQELPPKYFKIWVNILCIACETDGKLPTISQLSFKLRLTISAARNAVLCLVKAGLLDVIFGTTDCYTPHSWDKRQFKSDTPNERVQRYRKRQCNVTVTPPDTDTDTDTEEEKKDSQVLKKKPSSLKKPQDEDLFFSQFWNVFPSQRRADREGTFKAWKRATANTNPKIIIDAASIYRESSDVFRGFAKGPTAWLNQKCWEIDYQLQEEPEQHQTISAAEIHKIACTTG